MPQIIKALTAAHYTAAGALFKEYAQWLGIDLCFQQFDDELAQLPIMYGEPNGGIFLLKDDIQYIGCVGVRTKEPGIAELKRMYIQPAYHGKGLGQLLLQEAIAFATSIGFTKIRLDTLATMTPAIGLYKKNGFYEIPPYYFNPEANAVFFEKLL